MAYDKHYQMRLPSDTVDPQGYLCDKDGTLVLLCRDDRKAPEHWVCDDRFRAVPQGCEIVRFVNRYLPPCRNCRAT